MKIISRYRPFYMRSLAAGTYSMGQWSPKQPLPRKQHSYTQAEALPLGRLPSSFWVRMSADVYSLIKWALGKANSILNNLWVHKLQTQKSPGNFKQCAHLILERRMPPFLIQITGNECRSLRTRKNPPSLIKWNEVSASDLKVQLQSILILSSFYREHF